MTETAEQRDHRTTAERTTDWAFLDDPKQDRATSPVHITHEIRINGEKAEIICLLTEPIIVRNRGRGARSETLVGIVVRRDDVTFIDYGGGEAVDTIGGVPVLTPPARDEFSWHEFVDETRWDGVPPVKWVRVWVQARSVVFGYVGD